VLRHGKSAHAVDEGKAWVAGRLSRQDQSDGTTGWQDDGPWTRRCRSLQPAAYRGRLV